jgi:hypothetical protein
MSARLAANRIALGLTAALAVGTPLACALQATAAQAQTSATLTPTLSPDRLGARGALTLTVGYVADGPGVPSPVRKAVIALPAGLGLHVPTLRSCSPARLRARGASGCPSQARLGAGHALVESTAGSQLITEDIDLSLFIGPLQSFQPTFEMLGQGYTPLEKRILIGGTVASSDAPYGEELVMSIPPIPTLPLEPEASLASLTLTVGTSAHRLAQDANTIVVPSSCPAGGFPFAAEFTYADGSAGKTVATVPCPRSRK